MKRSTVALLLGLICAGCAQQVPMRDADQPNAATNFKQSGLLDGAPNPSLQGQILMLNPDGGKYFTLSQPFSETGRFDIELTFQQPNPHVYWLPSSSLCITMSASSQRYCLRFSSLDMNSPTIQVQSLFTDNNKITTKTSLPGMYRYGEPIRIRMRKAAGGAEFVYGAYPALTIATAGDIENLEISCSSASCRLRVDEI